MLTQFRIRNFRSIVDLHLDFMYGEGKAPNGYKKDARLPFLEVKTKANKTMRAVPVFAFYGVNAGGKSTIFDALKTLQFIVDKGIEGQYQPNKLHPELEAGSEFELSWVVGDKEAGYFSFQYCIAYTDDAVLHETLMMNERMLFRAQGGSLREAALSSDDNIVYTQEKVEEIYRTTCTDGEGTQVQPILSTISRQFPGMNPGMNLARSSISCMVIITDTTRLPYDFSKPGSLDDAAFARISEVMRGMDIDIESIYVSRERQLQPGSVPGELVEKQVGQLYVEHRTLEGKRVHFRIQEESQGTQILLMLYCLKELLSLEQTVVLIDELDNSIHPLLLRELVARFTARERNPLHCQLIFSAHNTDLLEGQHLRASEVGVVSKTRKKGTMVDRLCDLEGVRNIDNFRKEYLKGEYSGIPYIASL